MFAYVKKIDEAKVVIDEDGTEVVLSKSEVFKYKKYPLLGVLNCLKYIKVMPTRVLVEEAKLILGNKSFVSLLKDKDKQFAEKGLDYRFEKRVETIYAKNGRAKGFKYILYDALYDCVLLERIVKVPKNTDITDFSDFVTISDSSELDFKMYDESDSFLTNRIYLMVRTRKNKLQSYQLFVSDFGGIILSGNNHFCTSSLIMPEEPKKYNLEE